MIDIDSYEYMPEGIWAVQIQSVKGVMNLEGKHIFVHPHGFLFFHPPALGHDARWSFCPAHRIERMWQIATHGEGESRIAG